MFHAQSSCTKKNYNTFRLFEDSYQNDCEKDNGELIMPGEKEGGHYFIKLLVFFVFIGVIGLCMPPILSYALKTPYPLIVISEDSMRPFLAKNDLVLVKGVISANNIVANNIVVYSETADTNDKNSIVVARVLSNENDALVIEGKGIYSSAEKIDSTKIIGKVVGQNKILKLPWIGIFGKILK